MKIIIYKDINDNGVGVLRNLIKLLNLQITKTSIEKAKYNPGYPSLNSLSESLSTWKIESLPVSIQLSQLNLINYPAIAHLKKENSYFVVLQRLDNENIYYIDPQVGFVEQSINEFNKIWTRAALLVQTQKESGESHYRLKRRVELFKLWSNRLSYAIIVGLWFASSLIISGNLLIQFQLNTIGSLLSFFLIQKQYGFNNAVIDSFCKVSSKSDCFRVITSTISKFFGVFHLSELGMMYFIGNTLSIIFTALSDGNLFFTSYTLNLLIFPFSFYLIYYQWKFLKTWCPLCIATLLIFWSCAVTTFMTKSFTFTIKEFYIFFFSHSIPLALWLLFRNSIVGSFKIPDLERRLLEFTKNGKIFETLLSVQKPIDVVDFPNEIRIGDQPSTLTIILVSNPLCEPCIYAHSIVEELIERHKNLNVIFRFSIENHDNSTISNQMIRHLMGIKLNGSPKDVSNAMHTWFMKDGKSNIVNWMQSHPIEGKINELQLNMMIAYHNDWCQKINIKGTPTFFVNNRMIPNEYSLFDLKYHIEYMMKNTIG